MSKLDPVQLFRALCQDIPEDLRRDVFVTGSLAAAYAFKVRLVGQAVNTKDADLLVHPAGNVTSAQKMAERLLQVGWRPTDQCKPLAEMPDNPEELWAIRLMPANSSDYFIEFLNIPAEEQAKVKDWIPVQLNGGWYGLPSFKFMGLLACFRRRSDEGLEYAAPEMMALSNLLSHPSASDVEIESGEFSGLRRSAKDLGRVIALAYLSGRHESEKWAERWREALEKSFPRTWRDHASHAGAGLREMLADDTIMEQARKTTESGLLSGMGIDIPALRGAGERILVDAIEPLEQMSGG
jgi:hypothetical protein